MSETEQAAAPPVEEQPPQADTPPPINLEDDTAVDQVLQEGAIDVPDGESLIPSGNVGKVASAYRTQLKELKAELASAKEGSAKAEKLEQRAAQLEATLQAWQPYIQQIQQQQNQPPPKTTEDTSELEEFARDFDFYKTDGSLDLDRARRVVNKLEIKAQTKAQEQVAPFAEMTVRDRSSFMLARAKATEHPSGIKVDERVLADVWSQLSPAITATESGAKEAYLAALGRTVATMTGEQFQAAKERPRGSNGQFQAAPEKQGIPPPLYTEKAGGREEPNQAPLNDSDRKAMKAMGITEKEFFDLAKTMPRGTR